MSRCQFLAVIRAKKLLTVEPLANGGRASYYLFMRCTKLIEYLSIFFKNHSSNFLFQTWKKCTVKFSARCMKLVLARLVDRLPASGLHLAPGFILLANSTKSKEVLHGLSQLLSADAKGLTLLSQLTELLSSLEVKVQFEDPALLRQVKTLSEEVVDGLVTGENGTFL